MFKKINKKSKNLDSVHVHKVVKTRQPKQANMVLIKLHKHQHHHQSHVLKFMEKD